MASQAVLQFAEIHDMESTPVQEENGKKSLPPGSYYLLVAVSYTHLTLPTICSV